MSSTKEFKDYVLEQLNMNFNIVFLKMKYLEYYIMILQIQKINPF